MKFVQAFKCILLDSVDLVFMEAELNDIRGQVCRDLSQQVVGEVQQSEMVHVSECLGVNLWNLIVDQKETLFRETSVRIKLSTFKVHIYSKDEIGDPWSQIVLSDYFDVV